MIPYEQYGLQNISKVNSDAKTACDFSSLLVIQPPRESASDDAVVLAMGNEEQSFTFDTMRNYFNYPLVIIASLFDGAAELRIFYDPASLSESRVRAVAQHFDCTVEQLLAQEDSRSLGTVTLVGPWDIQHALDSSRLQRASMSCAHKRILDQIKTRPADPAIFSWDGNLTYSQLGIYASRLAVKLQEIGVGPEVIVPLYFPKSTWAVVAMVAVEMAGGAFVPLDPNAPISRLQGIVEDTKANMIISAPSHQEVAHSIGVDSVTLVDEKLLLELPDPIQSTLNAVRPHNASFVIFTSGSTGKPKGMIIQHDAICSSSDAYGAEVNIAPGTRVFNFSAYTFDVGILDVLVTLMRGACLCIPSDFDRLNNLAGAMNATKANWAFLTPTVVDMLPPMDLPYLKDLCLGGEAVTKKSVRRWESSSVKLHGIYGPAEASICAWNPDVGIGRATNIGRPLSSAFWVVNPANPRELVPVGCVGELLIQGPLLARGYINLGQDQDANWLENAEWLPSDGKCPKRAYRTGDMVRRNADGTFEYMGRKDTQVKLHGQRVELGEIESRLYENIPNNMSAIVDAVDGGSLLAFLWFTDSPQSQPFKLVETINQQMRGLISSLEESLAKSFPPYMVPSAYLIFEGKPDQMTSAKVDRKRLLRLAHSIEPLERARFTPGVAVNEPPTTPMEFKLRDLWATILQVDSQRIGKNNNFVQLGGDSIAAIKLVSAAQNVGLRLTVSHVFQCPRLADMAEVVNGGDVPGTYLPAKPFSLVPSLDGGKVMVEIRKHAALSDEATIQDAYPCTTLQEGLMSLAVKQPGSYIARHIYYLPDYVDSGRFRSAWERTTDICPILRTRIVILESYTIQALVKDKVVWESTDGQDLLSYLLATRNTEMGYGSPLSHFALIKDESGRNCFVWTAHHSIFDGWTIRSILDTLTRIYYQHNPPHLEPYSGFIKYVTEMNFEDIRDYWRTQLEGARPAAYPPPVRNATSGPKTDKTSRVFKTVVKFLQPQDMSITRATILRAAWALLLGKHCGDDDVCFGMTLSGRHAPVRGLDAMAGPTVATVPVRVQLRQMQAVSQFLLDVQDQASDMVAYEQFGLQNISKVSSDAQHACEFSSLLIIQPGKQLAPITNASDPSILETRDSDEALLEAAMENYFNYPLTLQCIVLDDCIEMVFVYDPTRLAEPQLEALSHQYEHLIHQLWAQDDRSLGTITAASKWDQQQALRWNEAAGVPDIIDSCAHHLIARQAELHPDAPAIFAWDATFSYKELDSAANRLSHYLIEEVKMKLDDLVHVCFEKSAWFIVAILAINKAGGAWVPLDHSHPTQRHQQVVVQTGSQLILVNAATAEKCSSLVPNAVEVGPVLDEKLRKAGYDFNTAASQTTAASVAYIIFTSGSTGVPKGITMEHGALCTSQTAIGKRLGVAQNVRMLQFSAYVFDVMIGEIFAPLFAGSCVCVPSEDTRMNNLTGFIRDADVNWVILTPQFARTLQPSDVPNLEMMLIGGEAIGQDLIDNWADKLRLFSGWGPAEACLAATLYEWRSRELPSLTIGSSVGSFCWIVDPDDHQKLAPIGSVGEIVIQGPTLLREYLADPEKTGISVVASLPDWAPWRDDLHWSRFYKTGDLGSYNPDGTIQFVSRKDTQVKIRGLRVELGDIEHHIRSLLPDVHEVVADVFKSDNSSRLVAFISFMDDRRVMEVQTNETEIIVTDLAMELKEQTRCFD